MRLAALWSGPLASNGRAVDELRIVVSGDARDVAARAELARVLEAADRLPEAITEHIALLRLEPLRVDSLRALRRLCERSGQRRRALRAAAALVALGLTDPGDARAASREPRLRWTPEANGTLTAGEFDSHVRHPDERHPATALLAAMSEVLPRLYGLALEDWGVTKQDRLAARSDDPVRALVGRVATLLGVEETFDVYLARSVATRVEIEAGPPPALLVPATLLSQPLQEACWQLGRQLGHLRAGTHGIARIPGKDLGLLVVAGVRTVYPGLRPRRVARGAAQRRGAEDRAHAAAAPAARVRAGRAVVPRRRDVRGGALARRACCTRRIARRWSRPATCWARSSRSRGPIAALARGGACSRSRNCWPPRATTRRSSR